MFKMRLVVSLRAGAALSRRVHLVSFPWQNRGLLKCEPLEAAFGLLTRSPIALLSRALQPASSDFIDGATRIPNPYCHSGNGVYPPANRQRSLIRSEMN